MRRAIYVILNAVYGEEATPSRGLQVGLSRIGQFEPLLTHKTYGEYVQARRAQIVASHLSAAEREQQAGSGPMVPAGA